GVGFGVVHQHAEIILEAEEKTGLGRHRDPSVRLGPERAAPGPYRSTTSHLKLTGCTAGTARLAPGSGGAEARAILATMSNDVIDLRNFYAQRLGVVARRFIGRGIRARFSDTRGLPVLAIASPPPYSR